ncbi:nitronate monooxygenase family protein [Pseudophaeobacter sp. EL27]|uniref:NAD(P)H-dependent flavin oxidoreductase n=1 Tax=Pseudophaeobacter sp. EL27 TaxID=2107580 RepID=UPI000EFC3142|nr:nitronate monooxygenase [Pseudophaeobacter sp. EL27]
MQGQSITARIGIDWPIFQAPMAGVSTPAMAAAVSEAGGLGALGIGAATPEQARKMIRATRALTDKPFNINVFCHRPAQADAAIEASWLDRLAPLFARFGAAPPQRLSEIYTSFCVDSAAQQMLLDEAPPVVSFHFGLPDKALIKALKAKGILLMATATSPDEGRAIQAAGIDAVVAQGWEAGGHRGIFDPEAEDPQQSTWDLTVALVAGLDIPVIAAGGLMTGGDIAHALQLGASAAQLGTAFVGSDESQADQGYRDALAAAAEAGTRMTAAISGRSARCLVNGFTSWAEAQGGAQIPDYPIAYDAGKALNAAAKSAGDTGFGAQWAGKGAAGSRPMASGEMLRLLVQEMQAAQGQR